MVVQAAIGVNRHNGGHHRAAGEPQASGADAALDRRRDPSAFCDGCPSPRSYATFIYWTRTGGKASGKAFFGTGTNVMGNQAQIE